MENSTISYCDCESLEHNRYYLGGLWTFLITGKDTGGQFSLIKVFMRKGLEPPMHMHTKEDEYYYLMDGEVLFTIGGSGFTLKAGDFITLPKHVPHQFKLLSETAKFLIQVMPAGLENMFMELSKPATALELPPLPAGPPPADFLKKVKELQQLHGIEAIDNTKIVAA